MLADNTYHLIAAARARAESTHRRATTAIQELAEAGDPITFQAVAAKAGVSRAWLYKTPTISEKIRACRPHTAPPATSVPLRQKVSDASLLVRLEAAQQRLKEALVANADLQRQLERALGAARATRQSFPHTER